MKHLIVVLGPTGVGKTALSLTLAKKFSTPVISADSRQIYKGIEIGTAAATQSERTLAEHLFVGIKELDEYYSAGQFEQDVLEKLSDIFRHSDYALMVGGSMMYIDAVCNGMDNIPSVDNEIRKNVSEIFQKQGLEGIRNLLQLLDSEHYKKVDLKNKQRLMHAVEVCLMTGKPYSSLLSASKKTRNFHIIKIGLNREREELYERINTRVEKMFTLGLFEEAKQFYHLKDTNALNTVGYKEIYQYMDGVYPDIETVKKMIKQNSRHYAKRQLTWFKRDSEIAWFHPDNINGIISYIESCEK